MRESIIRFALGSLKGFSDTQEGGGRKEGGVWRKDEGRIMEE